MNRNIQKKYTFENWVNGEVALNTCEIVCKVGEEPLVCSWDDILRVDVPKIQEKQKAIFEDTVHKLYSKWTNIFKSRYVKSVLKELLLQDEIDDFKSVLFGKNGNYNQREGYVCLGLKNHSSTLFTFEEIEGIRFYAEQYLKLGKEHNYSFVHSEKCPWQNPKMNQSIEAYSQAAWMYVKWLYSLLESQNNFSANQKDKEEVDVELVALQNNHSLKWNKIPISEIVTHFMPLTQKESKRGNTFLTTQEFLAFLKRAFLNENELEKPKFTLRPDEKGLIISLFYDFYVIAVDKYKFKNKKAPFVALIMDCFDNGWKESTVTRLFRPKNGVSYW